MKSTKKYLLAISGGPDSMFLLNKYKHKNIIIAHVNYSKRDTSDYDQKLVEDFCKKYNIPVFVLNLKNSKSTKNFQNWARDQRYLFFSDIYKKHQCDFLLTAHHKDDFIETALLQQSQNKKRLYYGMQKNTYLWNMNIYRPFLHHYFKKTIIKKITKSKLEYAIDITNFQDIYARNKIRLDLFNKSWIFKQSLYLKIKLKNILLNLKSNKIHKEYKKFISSNYSISVFKKLKYQVEIIYEFIHSHKLEIKLSKNKIESIIQFIYSQNMDKIYVLKNNIYLEKKHKKIMIKH